MRLASLVPLLLVAACAATSNDVSSTASAVSGQDICNTLDYGPRTAPNDAYFFFADSTAASAYMQKAQAAHLLEHSGGADATFAEIEAPDSRLGRMVAEVFAGYHLVFPTEMAGLDTPPPVAMVTTKVLNAFVFGQGAAAASGDEKKIPWIFVVQSGLADVANDDELRAVVAHELGHLLLRNAVPAVKQFIRASYQIGPAGEDGVLAESQANDIGVDDRISTLQNLEERVGQYYEVGFDPTLTSIYTKLVTPFVRTNSVACNDAIAASDAWEQVAWPFVVATNLSPNPADTARLAAAQTPFLEKLKICFAESTDTRTLAEDLATTYQIAPENIQSALFDEERDADADPTLTNLPLRLLHAEEALRAKAIAWRSDPAMPAPALRYYDQEEDADDDSVRVLRAIGKTAGLVDTDLLFLSPATRAACLAEIAADSPLEYGQLSEPHHTNCWRAYHMRQLTKALDACPTTAPAKRSRRAPIALPPSLLPPPLVID